MLSYKNIFYSYRVVLFSLILLCAGLFFIFVIGSIPPSNFPNGKIVYIPRNSSLGEVAQIYASNNVIKSPFLFKVYTVLIGGHNSLKAGGYQFSEPESTIRVAIRTSKGIQNIPKVKITIPEGSNSYDIAWAVLKGIPNFHAPAFLALAKPLEGYLFPDTYFIGIDADPESVVAELKSTYEKKVAKLVPEFTKFGKKESDIIKMASIVEREANNQKDRKIIAGILWRRLEMNMALQVDATFWYLYGKSSSQLTTEDLAVDNRYNLYKYTGLPPTPISNPGLDTIRDTINPTETKYLYYLTGKDGVTYYASTLEGHALNKNKYLR